MPCHLYSATDGGAGRASGVPVSSPDELRALRRAELREGCRILGMTSVTIGDADDGRLASADPEALIGALVRAIRTHRPDVVITFGPEGAPTRHRDHRVISRAATAAFFLAGIATELADDGVPPHAARRLFYTSWPDPPAGAELPARAVPLTARLDVRPWLETKRRAFLAHATQRDHLARFEELAMSGEEWFALAAGVPQPAPVIDDLLAGL